MKKVLGIVVLVLALSLVSVPAFAQTAELNLKYWYAGVGGADLWVADYGEYEYTGGVGLAGYGVHQLNGYPAGDAISEEKLVLQPGKGGNFILSGSYFLYPTISIGISYWGLNRAGTVGVDFIAKEMVEEEVDPESGESYREFVNGYSLRVPWWDKDFSFTSYAEEWWEDESLEYRESYGEAFLTGEGGLSMSALDIFATKALAGPSWEAALSGGIRRATFDQNQSTELKYYGWKDEYPDSYESGEWNFDLDSKLSFSAIGPQVGIEGDYALGDKLVLKAGAKAGFLFGTATSAAQWRVEHAWRDVYFEDNIEVVETDWDSWSIGMPHSATESVQINTYDLSVSLGYRITEQWSVEAGYYVSFWKGVPSLYIMKCNDINYEDDLGGHLYGHYYSYDDYDSPDYELWTWEQPEPRDITVSGLTIGVNLKF
jgi:hypothetical protein